MTVPILPRSLQPRPQGGPGAFRALLDRVSGAVIGAGASIGPRPAELSLTGSPDLVRQLIDLGPDAITIHERGYLVYVNQAALRLFGARDAGELIGSSILDRVHPDQLALARDYFRRMPNGRGLPPTVELQVLRMDGSPIHVEVRASPFVVDGRTAVQVVVREISERKRGEQLQDAVYCIAQAAEQATTLEDLYRQIHAIISGVMPAENFFIALYDAEKDILSFPYFVDQVDTAPQPRPAGRTLTEYVLRTGRSLLCTEEVDAELRARGEVELVGEPSAIWLGVPLLVRDKTIGAMVVQHYSNRTAYGEREQQMLEFVSSQVGQAIDRKSQSLARAAAEAALRASEERYRNLVDNAPIGIYRTTPDGRILAANPAIVRMLGYNSPAELTRIDLEREGKQAGYRAAQFGNLLEQDGLVRGLESAWQRRDGAEIIVRENAQAVRGPGGEILYFDGTVEDITERRRMEESERELRALAEALRDTAALLNSTLNQDEVLDLILANLGRVVAHDASSVMIVENGVGRIVRTRGYAERGAEAQVRAIEFRLDDNPPLREMARTGRSSVIPDVRAFPAWARLPHTDWIRSHASAPIRVRGRTIGFIGVGSTIPGFFKEEHGARLQAFADQASVALENARLLSETERRANQFAVLYESAQELALPRDLGARLDMIVDRARALLGAGGAFIYLYDAARDELELTIEKGLGTRTGLRLKSGEGLAGRVAASRQPQLVDDYSAWAERADTFEGCTFRAIVEVPVIHAGELLGVLGVSEMEASTRQFGEEDLQLLTLFAGQAANAIKSARLLDETRTRAQQLALLYDAGLTLNGVLEPRAQLEFLFKIAMRALHADRAEFFRYDPLSRELNLELGVDAAGAELHAQTASRSPVDDELSPLAWVFQHRVPLNIPELADDPRTGPLGGDLASAVWAPVEHTGEVRGVLAVFSARPAAFSPQDERLLVLFANQAAVALENARLYTEARQELTERKRVEGELRDKIAALRTLAEIDRQVMAATDPGLLMELVCTRTAELLRVPTCIIAAAEGAGLRVLGSRGASNPEALLAEIRSARAGAVSEPAFGNCADRAAAGENGFRSMACVPLRSGENSPGNLFVFDAARREWTPDEIELLNLLAGQAAIALEKTRLLSELADSLALTTQFYRVTGEVLQADSLQETARLITQALRETLSADFASIALADEQGRHTFVHGVGYPDKFFSPPPAFPDQMAVAVGRTGRPVVVDDPQQLPPAMRDLGVQASICLPLHGEGSSPGVLFVQYVRPHVFAERELQTLSLFANQASLAMRRVRLLEQTRARAAQLAALNRIAGAASRSQDLDALLDRIYLEVRDTVSTDGFFIALWDEATDELDFRLSVDEDVHLPPARLPRQRVPLTSYALDSRQPTYIADMLSDTAEALYPRMTLMGTGSDPRTWLGIPLHVGDKIVGLLSVQSYRPDAYAPEERQLIETIADQAAIALQNARLFDETRQRLAEMEAVNRISTGVRSAASMEEMLPRLLSETLEVLDAADGMLAFYDGSSGQLAVGAARGWFTSLPLLLSPSDGVLGRVLGGATDLSREPGGEPFAAERTTPAGYARMVVPILAGQDRVGVLAVLVAHPREFSSSEARLLETIAEIAGTAVQRIRLSGKVENAFLETALALARIVDARDSESSGHSDRLAEIAVWLAGELDLSPQEQEDLRLAARLHDIGKAGVPEAILLKPDSLEPAEWSVLKQHPAIGAEIIQPLRRLRGVAPLVLHHQERFDGTGYPDGLAGDKIPLGARILAVADAVSAMLDGRIYRKARSWVQVRAELARCAGSQFDPQLVDLLLKDWPELRDKPSE